MYCLVHDFLELMLKILLNSAPDSVNKSCEFAQTYTNEVFEFFSDNADIGFNFYFLGYCCQQNIAVFLKKMAIKITWFGSIA